MIFISLLEVNLNKIKENIFSAKKLLNPKQKLCLVLKANAYGLGARKICKFANTFVNYFAVSSYEEFLKIYKISQNPILILDPVIEKVKLKKAILKGAEITISNKQNLNMIIEIVKKISAVAKVHIAINSGMNRFGFSDLIEIKSILKLIKDNKKIKLIGVFSHFSMAQNEEFAFFQKQKFNKIKQVFEKEINKPILFHMANSCALKNCNCFDMTRVGEFVYLSNNQVLSLKSKIIEIQHVKANESVGYDGVFKPKTDSKIAIAAIGYGDGIFKKLTGNGECLICGKRVKIVAVCMDVILIDISNIQAKIGDEVVLIGKSEGDEIFICEMANWCDTITYEIIAHLNGRIKRKYIGENYADNNGKISCKKVNFT
ncbi:MAG: alanine racemase [Clostridia bacterium]|nr:alanine racemase [Clostridia bacterium]